MRRLLTQLEPLLTSAGLKPDEAFPLIAPLLNLPVPAKYPPLAIFTRTATPPLAGHNGRMDTRRRTRAAVNNCDRGFTLGRPFDAGTDSTAGRTRHYGTVAAPLYCAARVPSPMAVAGASYAD